MDASQFDNYGSYSDTSTPRTPSPRTSVSSDDMHYQHSPHFKPNLDLERNIFVDNSDDNTVAPETHSVEPPYWTGGVHGNPFAFNSSRGGSLLQELYDHDVAPEQPVTHDLYLEQSAEPPFAGRDNWNNIPHTSDPHQHHQHQSRGHQDYTLMRRATFPYVRHDRDDGIPLQHYPSSFLVQDNGPLLNPFASRHDTIYGEPLPLSADPSSLHNGDYSLSSSPHSSYQDFEDTHSIKLEDSTPIMVPSQTAFYRPQSSSPCHPMSMSYLSPHTGLPVQHTDDAASKETQYLRRRCFNCHTTEPPSWRRSTLNPGKIVCNKCGLYERTHLRPRPLRFDELRAGNKARKQSKGTVSPKAKMAVVKKEPREYGLVRRSSVSSSTSSVHSGSGASDWDDNVSVYSAGSAPPTSFNSPNLSTFPLRNSQSPSLSPRDGGIRLPNAPLSDIASLQPSSPRKAHTSPYYSPAASMSNPNVSISQQEFYRRGSMPDLRPETTGWQSVPLEMAGGKEGALVQGPMPTAVAS